MRRRTSSAKPGTPALPCSPAISWRVRTLFVSEATVKTHVNRIFAKTVSRDRSQALRYAYTHGYAAPE